MEHKALLQESCEKMGVSLTEEMASQFMTYLSLLLEWNEKMNLTAITDKKDVVQKHFVDCLSILPHLSLTGQEKIIDVGTGAGFPGIPSENRLSRCGNDPAGLFAETHWPSGRSGQSAPSFRRALCS